MLIASLNELIANLRTIENYLTEGNFSERNQANNLIKRGTCFVAYKIGKEIRFAPSRFIGYTDNSLAKHSDLNTKDGRETNKAINKLLQPDPIPDQDLETKYLSYCENMGIHPGLTGAYGAPRKYWTLVLEGDFLENLELSGEFPEGKIVERKHKASERNSRLIKFAKDNFRKVHGRLFCQICGFDFEKKYGVIGIDFIEGHHTVVVGNRQCTTFR